MKDKDVLTDNALDLGHEAAGRRQRGFLREVTRIQDVVNRCAMLAVVEQLIMLGILKTGYKPAEYLSTTALPLFSRVL